MAKLPAAKVGYLKKKKKFSQLSKDFSLLQSVWLLQILMWFEVSTGTGLSQEWP